MRTKQATGAATTPPPISALVKAVMDNDNTTATAGNFSCSKENGYIVLKCNRTEIASYDISDGIVAKVDIFNAPDNANYKGVILPAINAFENSLQKLGYQINGYTE